MSTDIKEVHDLWNELVEIWKLNNQQRDRYAVVVDLKDGDPVRVIRSITWHDDLKALVLEVD